MNSSAGQSVIGYATSTGYKHDIGYWYGGSTGTCNCGDFCDLNLDQAINPADVVNIVSYVYKQIDLRQQIPTCPGDNGDWNCDGTVNPADVVNFVNYVYKGMTDQPPCDPCACTVYPPVNPGDCP